MFDRSGSGFVNVDEFVIGMIEKLFSLYSNTVLLHAIATEVLSFENRSAELAVRLEKESATSDKLQLFRVNLKSLLYIIRDKLRNPPKSAPHAVNLDMDTLVR
jgi:hypothetical protein